MDHFAGLDVSVKETSVCIVDDTGKIIREVKVADLDWMSDTDRTKQRTDALLAAAQERAPHIEWSVITTSGPAILALCPAARALCLCASTARTPTRFGTTGGWFAAT